MNSKEEPECQRFHQLDLIKVRITLLHARRIWESSFFVSGIL
ncbi:hypothetical protein DsansV1_C26g0193041 [Dioscorea sansibarensis]